MISRTTLIKCTYCEQIRQNQYLEPVTQIPRDKCTQEFIVSYFFASADGCQCFFACNSIREQFKKRG